MFSSLARPCCTDSTLVVSEKNLEFKVWMYGLIGSSKKVKRLTGLMKQATMFIHGATPPKRVEPVPPFPFVDMKKAPGVADNLIILTTLYAIIFHG